MVVSHNGGDYLPTTLAALKSQTRPADSLIGVDTGSLDNSASLLERFLGADRVVSYTGGTPGMGAAIQAGLNHLAPAAESAPGDWIWLLHDDAAPAPGALSELLGAVERAPSVTVAGCKQLDWHADRRLVDVGLSISRWAERLTLMEADELDQGQYDGRTDTFAVNSAGMLIRRDVWDQLGGFDPALPGTGDDVDFCWRNRVAGHRVVVVPSAKISHVVHRPHALGTAAAARRAQVHLRLKHCAWWQVPLHAVGAILGSIFRLVVSIAVKDPGHGFSQVAATFSALARPRSIARARRSAARTRRMRRSLVRKLQTSRREVWSHRRSLMEAIGSSELDVERREQDALADQPTGDAADDFAALTTSGRGWVGIGALAVVLVTLAAAMISLSALFGADALSGGALLPVSPDLMTIWQHASGWWILLGAGLPGHGDPFGYVLWILGLLGAGNANAAIVWVYFLALPLAGLGAWFAAGALTGRRRTRMAAALMWAAAPVLQVAVDQGRLGALIAHVVIPFLALGLLRATGTAIGHGRFAMPAPGERRFTQLPPPKAGINGVPSWTAAAAAGLALAVVTASAPSLFIPSVAAIVVSAVLLRRRGRTLWWSLLPAVALFLPMVVAAIDRPRSLLADPGQPLGFSAAPLWQQILGQPLDFGMQSGITGLSILPTAGIPWALILTVLLGGPVLLFALVALFLPGRRTRPARLLWLVAALMLGGGWAVGRISVALTSTEMVSPFPGSAVSAATFALLAAAVIGADKALALSERPQGDSKGGVLRQSMATVVVAAVMVGPLVGLVAWTAKNVVDQPVDALSMPTLSASDAAQGSGVQLLVAGGSVRTLPATAIDRGVGPEKSRTLLMSTDDDGAFEATLMRGAGTTLDALSTIASARSIMGAPGQETIRADDQAGTTLRNVVAVLAAGQGVDPRPELEALGVGFVVLRADDTAAQLTASRMDAVPGLVAVGETDTGWLWRVAPAANSTLGAADVTHRARITDAAGTTIGALSSGVQDLDASVPEGEEGRLLVLAERSDTGWKAQLNGVDLTPASSGWAQAFELPASGGTLSVRYDNPWAYWLGGMQIVVIGLTVLLAIPMPVRRPSTGLSRDEGSLRKERIYG